MLRRFVFGIVLLVGLAALADRALATYAGRAVGRAVQRTERLSERPEVTFHGFPFVTQAVGRKFHEVELTVRGLRREQVTISRIDATLREVEVGLGDALAGEVEAVPVSSGTATVTITYADLNAYLSTRSGDPQVGRSGTGGIEVRVTVGVPGQGTVPVLATGTLSVADGTVRARITGARRVDGGSLPDAARAEAMRRAAVTVPLRTLPFGITVTTVEATVEGVVLRASAKGIVIRAR